jgi:hypothetical protein
MEPLLLALVESGLIGLNDAERIDRSLDPARARLHAESLLIESFRNGLSRQQRRALDLLDSSEGRPTAKQLSLFWDTENTLLWRAVSDDVTSVALERAISASIGLGDASMWELVNEEVISFVEDYYISADADNFGSIPNLNQTAKTIVGKAINDWQRGELQTVGYNEGLPTLIRALTPAFGGVRAEAIGITESTRLWSFAELASGNANPDIAGWIYNNAQDSRVSEFCINANGAVMLKGEGVFSDGLGPPPRHPRCRSGIQSVTGPALAALREQGLATA